MILKSHVVKLKNIFFKNVGFYLHKEIYFSVETAENDKLWFTFISISLNSLIGTYCHQLSSTVTYCHQQSPTVTNIHLVSSTVTSVTCCNLLSTNVIYCHLLSPTVTYCHLQSPTVTNCHLQSSTVTYSHIKSPHYAPDFSKVWR